MVAESGRRYCHVIDARLTTLRKTDAEPNNPVLHFARRTGRGARDEHTEPINRSEYVLSMNPDSGLTRDVNHTRLATRQGRGLTTDSEPRIQDAGRRQRMVAAA